MKPNQHELRMHHRTTHTDMRHENDNSCDPARRSIGKGAGVFSCAFVCTPPVDPMVVYLAQKRPLCSCAAVRSCRTGVHEPVHWSLISNLSVLRGEARGKDLHIVRCGQERLLGRVSTEPLTAASSFGCWRWAKLSFNPGGASRSSVHKVTAAKCIRQPTCRIIC